MLIPREHGAYGQLLFPLVSALIIGRPAAGAYLLAGASVAAFLAHEPLLVLLGQRGGRAAREEGSDARRSLALFGAFCAVSGLVALAVLPVAARYLLLVPVGFTGLVGMTVLLRRERTTAGEMLVAAALASVALPVAVAGSVDQRAAVTLCLVFAAVFMTATVAVRAVIGRVARAGGPPLSGAAALALGVVAVLTALGVSGRVAPVAPYAALPVCAIALGLAAQPPLPRHLRAIGWTLVGATATTTVLLVIGLRER